MSVAVVTGSSRSCSGLAYSGVKIRFPGEDRSEASGLLRKSSEELPLPYSGISSPSTWISRHAARYHSVRSNPPHRSPQILRQRFQLAPGGFQLAGESSEFFRLDAERIPAIFLLLRFAAQRTQAAFDFIGFRR